MSVSFAHKHCRPQPSNAPLLGKDGRLGGVLTTFASPAGICERPLRLLVLGQRSDAEGHGSANRFSRLPCATGTALFEPPPLPERALGQMRFPQHHPEK